ncbi:MAG TPA: site-specific DNA-methyltransferase [Lachnospiraceae bacterium]|nr:site-specific DNA-methyltransferase [Lachnospiraceae bacterium]
MRIMANINETISEVAKLNPELARQIQKYVKDHSYGLVFEHNLPEAVRLYKKQPAVGDTVNILAPRGKKETEENSVPWCVKYIDNGVAYLEHDGEAKDVPLEDICVLVSYRDVIYPGLKEIDRVERGNPEDPYHMVINSENYHALEALTYAYAGKVDCIYIDPPYNKKDTKDWKYNCNYVDGNDQYKHSKWLAFVKRRLKLAKQLLNPEESVLIVTIDEVEYARLALLLEQMFPDAKIQMVSSVINHAGAIRQGEFARTNEFIFFVMLGNAFPAKLQSESRGKMEKIHWDTLRRTDVSSKRGSSKGGTAQFYPIYVNDKTKRIVAVGKPLTPDEDIESVPHKEGCTTVFPIRKDGLEMNWGLLGDVVMERASKGYISVGKYLPNEPQKYSISYLTSGKIEDIDSGKATVKGYGKNGAVIAVYEDIRAMPPTTQWDYQSHDAYRNGTVILNNILGSRFSFPKSVYAVQDCIKLFVRDKQNALIVDFFAGSGTTLHAVNLLNAEDGGHRRCICVTNNEVSEAEEKKFVADGLRPSDPDWEKYGIVNYVTWPRTVCSIEGHDVNGKPLEGDYGKPSKDIDLGYSLPKADGFKANAVFCELTYESAWPIRLDNAFNAIAPILWMQAGCQGPIIRKIGKSYLTTDYYGVLFDYGQASKFCEKVKNTPTIKTVFVVTDDQRRYSNMCKRLSGIEVHRLYETFLRTFEICGEGGLD